MAIKAIINNTEKEIEQIKNSDEQDIDYVYSRIGDTEVEGEPPISIKSIGGNLADYRIYGNTVGGESVGDRTGNLFDGFSVHGMVPSVSTGELTNSPSGGATTDFIAIDNGNITLLKSNVAQSNMYIFLYAQDKSYIGYSQTTAADTLILYGNSINGYQNAKYARIRVDVESAYTQTNIMLNAGSTALPYEPYGYKVPVTVEGKNLLENTATNQTINGVTFTVNTDGSITCSGIPTSGEYADLVISGVFLGDTVILENGNYIVSCANASNNASLLVGNSEGEVGRVRNAEISISANLTWAMLRIRQADPAITLYPMIRRADIEDDTYEPYHAPVTTPIYLPEQIRKVGDEAEYISYSEQKLHRVRKNLLQNQAVDREIEGVTFTVNSDGSITCNGTASDNTNSGSISSSSLPAGSYYLNGTPSGGSLSTYYMYVACYTESEIILYNDVGDGVSFTIDNSCNINVRIAIKSGCTCNNLTFYPMIRKADITDDTYEPYIVNTEVNTNLPALSTIKGTNTFSVNTSVQPSNIYIKDSFDYKKVFTATRTIEGELPLNYRSIEDNDSTLKNYRIYGNTVGGESVGDKTENLFDLNTWANTIRSISGDGLMSISGSTVSITSVNATDCYTEPYANSQTGVYKIPVKPNTIYTVNWYGLYYRIIILENGSLNYIHNFFSDKPQSFTTHSDTTFLTMRFGVNPTNPLGTTATISDFMLSEGSTVLPYEPYGYKVPVTVEGKNLFDYSSGITYSNSTLGNTNMWSYSSESTGTVLRIPCSPNTIYTLSISENIIHTAFRIATVDSDNVPISGQDGHIPCTTLVNDGSLNAATFTTPDMAKYLLFQTNTGVMIDIMQTLMLNTGAEPLPYEPYHAPVTTPIYLPEPIKMVGDEAEYIDYAEQKQHRVRKNLLRNTATSREINGVTFTVNSDRSIICNGQALPGNADFINSDFLLSNGTYILTGCPNGGTERETYKILLYINGAWKTNDKGSGAEFTLTETSTVSVKIVIYAGYTCDNLTFYPMIRKAGIEDDTYEPYIENTDLDVTLPALPTLTGTNVLTVGTAVQPSEAYIKGKIKEIN